MVRLALVLAASGSSVEVWESDVIPNKAVNYCVLLWNYYLAPMSWPAIHISSPSVSSLSQ